MAKRITICAGIDTGKYKLDVAIDGSSEQLCIDNTVEGHQALVEWLKRFKVKRIGIEASGGYEQAVVAELRRKRFVVVLFQPKQVRAYGTFHQLLAKNDKIDAALIASLVVMVIISGYENFVSRIDTIDERDRSEWMGTVDFGAMKTKLVGSIIAIASIYLLALALDIGSANRGDVLWTLIVQGGLVVSGLALAAMDWIAGHRKG